MFDELTTRVAPRRPNVKLSRARRAWSADSTRMKIYDACVKAIEDDLYSNSPISIY